MNNTELHEKRLALAEKAYDNIKTIAEEDRKLTHTRYIADCYRKALDHLEHRKSSADLLLRRVKAIGR